MIWHVILLLLSPLAAVIGRLMPDHRDREILALRQQVLILHRQLGKRPRLTRSEKLTLVLTCLRMKKQQLLNALLIVKPATVVGWHRQIVRRHWTFKQKRRPGRPRVDSEVEELVVLIARENLRWGYTKIAGEVRKLGYPAIGRSTVERIMKRHGLAPRPQHGGLSWADFLGHYGQFIWASDFFTVTTATLRTYYVLFFMEISTRRIVYWNVSRHPNGEWVAQQFRNLAVIDGGLPRHLIHDRDTKFTAHADELLRAMGTEAVRLPVRSPDLNGRAERWVGTARQECLDHVIILNECHLRWALGEFTRYYNHRRPHRSLQLHPPDGPVASSVEGKVVRRKILGGLINDYHRKAA
jgi:transposase InsO family protein